MAKVGDIREENLMTEIGKKSEDKNEDTDEDASFFKKFLKKRKDKKSTKMVGFLKLVKLFSFFV